MFNYRAAGYLPSGALVATSDRPTEEEARTLAAELTRLGVTAVDVEQEVPGIGFVSLADVESIIYLRRMHEG